MFWPHLILEWIYLHESQTNRGFINANSINLIHVVRFALPRKDCDEFIDCHYSERNRHLFKIKLMIKQISNISYKRYFSKLARRDDLLELKFM